MALSASGSEGWAVGGNPSRESMAAILNLSRGEWSVVAASTSEYLQSVALTASGSESWAVGVSGTILHLSGGEWSRVNGPATASS
jgi:hypothetical protein